MKKTKASLLSLMAPYKMIISVLAALSVAASGLGLVLPKLISYAIDAYVKGSYDAHVFFIQFGVVILGIYLLTYAQSIVQTYAAERVALDLRRKVVDKVSRQEYATIEQVTPGKLLTNLTADINSIKMFIGQATATLISSVIVLIGAAIFLISINIQLALVVLTIIPVIAVLFAVVLTRVRVLIKKAREIIDRLNQVINESIIGATLVRVLHIESHEAVKFERTNSQARDMGIQILRLFASMIPVVIFISNLASVAILTFGGYLVINNTITLGDFTAFSSYVGLLIFPILVIGMMSNLIAQAAASYARISEVLMLDDPKDDGITTEDLKGKIQMKDVTLTYGGRDVLKHVSFSIEPGSKVAIIGPTAAGKTQLLNILIGLKEPTSGAVRYDDRLIEEYQGESLHRQIGFVFQDSVLFNLTLRENIAFGGGVTEHDLQKAIYTAELSEFVNQLPDQLNTVVSERGGSLSGGQKQRIMLARALALNPRILLLDDFTARLDTKTESKILENISVQYPDITLVSVTQKIAAIEHYEKILVLTEGELIAEGTHHELMTSSPEYVQIYNSQQSTTHYE